MFNLSPAARKITAALGAAALALGAMTATALPARANGDDLARVLIGTAAIVAIGSALNNANRGYGPDVSRERPWEPAHGWHHDRRGGWHQPQPRPRWTPPPPPPPQTCAVWINGQRYVRSSRDCRGGPEYRPPHPHDPRYGWQAPYHPSR
ncbi:MAG: hypothetical protein ACK4S2_07465 [Gemmobacter sp.]|uniref:hypothetical protein n=1 Tax=Gemmobacter sp. TaxID=1898957 RepID=UPI00391AF0CB